MTRETFKTNFPADAEISLRGDLGNKIGRALNDASGQGRTTRTAVRRGPITLQSGVPRERWVVSDLVRNASATALTRGKILQIGDELGYMAMGANDISDVLSADGLASVFYEPCLVGKEPQGVPHQIGVLMADAGIGGVAECQLSGICTAWVNVTDTDHGYAKANAGSHMLQSAASSSGSHAKIYWKPDATGEQLCRVVLGEVGGGSHVVITFRVLSIGYFVDPNTADHFCRQAQVEVLSVSCGGSGVEPGDEVTVWDPYNCYFDIPIELLYNMRGTAIQMAWDAGEAGAGTGTGTGTDDWTRLPTGIPPCFSTATPEQIEESPYADQCWWMVQTMCCVEDWFDGT